MVVLVKCVRLALSEQSERKYASRVSVSEHMRVGFFERKRKNAREQARPEFRLSGAKSMKKFEKIRRKKLKLRVCKV